MRSRSDRDRELQLSWAHAVTLIHIDINFRVTDSVATFPDACLFGTGTLTFELD